MRTVGKQRYVFAISKFKGTKAKSTAEENKEDLS